MGMVSTCAPWSGAPPQQWRAQVAFVLARDARLIQVQNKSRAHDAVVPPKGARLIGKSDLMRLNKLVARDLLDCNTPDNFLYPLSFAVNFWFSLWRNWRHCLGHFFVEACLLGLLSLIL